MAAKIIIDTDIGEDIDDILTAAFALRSPEFEVLAITTVDGDTRARSRIARRLTAVSGKPGIPVAAGYAQSMPFANEGVVPGESVTQGELAPTEEGLPPESELEADELIAKLAAEHPGEVSLLTIGALTNAGQTFVRYPEAARMLRGVVTNGGRFERPPVSIGWNLRYDPVAAAVVACSAVQWTLLPETAMGAAPLAEEHERRIREAGTELTDLLSQAIELWRANKPDAAPSPHLSDLNVFAHLINPDWAPVRPGRATIAVAPDRAAELWVEVDVTGPHLLGEDMPVERAAELRQLFMERILR